MGVLLMIIILIPMTMLLRVLERDSHNDDEGIHH